MTRLFYSLAQRAVYDTSATTSCREVNAHPNAGCRE